MRGTWLRVMVAVGCVVGWVVGLTIADRPALGQSVGEARRSADTLTVRLIEPGSNVFGDSKVTFHAEVRGLKGRSVRLGWTLAANHRTIDRAETVVRPDDGTASVPLTVRVPPVREGVVFPVELTVTVTGSSPADAATQRRRLWVFGREPFADRQEWLKELDITLFDDEGSTADQFDAAEIPYRFLKNTDALAEVDAGLVVVAEGVSWADRPGLGPAVLKLAASGRPVLCLAPADGALPWPGSDQKSARPEVSLRSAQAILALDKRLDTTAWSAEGEAAHTVIRLMAKNDDVVAAFAEGQDGWPWLELHYRGSGGRLVVCGYGVIRHWEAGPTSRFLLARLLEELVPLKTAQSNR